MKPFFTVRILLMAFATILCVLPISATSGYVGRTEGELTITPLGQANYEIPIPAIPGTGGMVPHLSISYNSSNRSGLLGYGFDLTGLSVIGRVPQNLALDGRVGEVTFTADDRFALDGTRLVVTDTVNPLQRIYSTEMKNYARVTAYGPEGDPTSFTVETKDGITYEYAANTRILQPSSTEPGLFWMLTRATDTSGNYFTVTYQGNNEYNEIYPTRIDYTGNSAAGLQPYASVRLSYVDRPDTAYTYLYGHVVRHLKCVNTIGIYYGDSMVRSYRMGYTVNNYHNLLTSVTEVASNNTEKNPTLFQWYTVDNLTVNGQNIQTVTNLYHVTLHVGDFNGDGKDDYVALPADDDAPYKGWQLFTSNGSTFSNPGIGPLYNNNIPKQVVVADFNGDGRADMAVMSKMNSSYDMARIYLSTGTGFLESQNVAAFNRSFHILPIEVNGDGASDLLLTFDDDNDYRIYLSSLFDPNYYSINQSVSAACSQEWDKVIPVDINGDGLTDIINMRSNNSCLMIANGQGGFTERSFGYGTSEKLLFGDFNADGKDDYLYCAYNGTPLSTGWPLFASAGDGNYRLICYVQQPFNPMNVEIFVADVNCDGYADLLTVNKTGNGQPCVYLNDCMGHFFPQTAGSSSYGTNMWNYYLGDFNGDGKSEFVCTADYQNATWPGCKLLLLPNGLSQLLSSITDGMGNTTEIDYKYMSDASIHTRGTTHNSNLTSFSSSWPIVYQVKTPDGLGGKHTTSYHYEDALLHHKGRGVLGFSRVSSTDIPTGIVTTTVFSPSVGRYIMSPVHKETRIGGQLLSESDITYNITPSGTYAFSHLPVTVSDKTYEYTSGQLLTEEQTEYTYDNYGNPTRTEVTNGDITITTVNTYNNNESTWRLGRLTASTVTKQGTSGTSVQRAQFEYETSTGLLKAEVSEPYNTTLGYRKSYIRDAFGNITSSTTTPLNTTFAARTESTTYDTKGRFLLKQTNSMGHTITNSVDVYSGLMYSSVDANSITTGYTYDSFGRCKTVTTSIGSTTITVNWSEGHTDAPATALYYTRTETTGQPFSLVFSDCLGRTVRTVTENAFGQKIYTDVVYNNKGQVWKTSEPYFPGNTPLWNVNTYDNAGRIHTQTDAAGSVTTFTYNGYTTTVTDALGHSTVRETDCHGNLVQSTDHEGGTIEYQYDLDGHCTQLAGPRTTVTMQYDLRGNRTRLDDPDLGTTTSVYNAYGEMVSQTDSKGTTTYAYDLLGRITTETRPDVTITNVYDTRFVGAVTSTSASNSTSTQYYYDSYGRTIQQVDSVGGYSFTVATSYDVQNHPATITYPNNYAIDYGYSTNGLLTSVKDHSTHSVIWQLTQQDARGNATEETLGNGLVTTNTYNAATGHITAISTPGIQNWTYAYDAIGDLIQRKDVARNMTEGFTYDTLGRLVEVKKNGQTVQQSAYDAAGNVISRTGVGHGFTYEEGTNRLTGFYEENAYVRLWDEIQYTSFHKVSRIKYGSDILELTYGPSKSRSRAVRKRNSSTVETKYYVGSLYELSTGSTTVKICYIYAGGKAVALRETKGSTTRMLYLHHDHLGSVIAYSDARGNLVQELSYDAWGRRRNPATWQYYATASDAQVVNPWGFSGHEHIDLFELVNMDGRMYDPVTGRFLSPDPYVQAPDFTQGLNRYSYCLNNPLSLIDPTGYSWLSDNWKSLLAATVGIVVSAVTMGSVTPVAVFLAGAAGGAAGALTGALLNGANIGQIAKATITGAVIGGFSAVLNGAAGDGSFLERLFKHTFSQGWLEGVQGGNIFHGMMMGAISGAGGHYIDKNLNTLGKAGEIAASAVLGGTVDELGGGKFANGAITSAFSIMFNDMIHPKNITEYRRLRKKEIEKDGKLSFYEAQEWWAIGNGETLEIDVNSLNLDFLDVSNMKPGFIWGQSLEPGGKHQWGVFGNVTIGYLGNNEVVVFPDYYDFNIIPNPNNDPDITRRNRWTKIDKVIHGNGNPYKIVFKGKYKLK
ncbi:MAG: VCBS repeat-containing protein [Prevotella sp.]|nr:VCBS repeat-containing protein [Prevotella sp.]